MIFETLAIISHADDARQDLCKVRENNLDLKKERQELMERVAAMDKQLNETYKTHKVNAHTHTHTHLIVINTDDQLSSSGRTATVGFLYQHS